MRFRSDVQILPVVYPPSVEGYLSIPYLAGLFDGEGSIGIYPSYGRPGFYSLRAQMGLVDRHLLVEIQRQWGGSVSRRFAEYENRKPFFSWVLHGDAAALFLQTLLPFLIIKADKALLGVEFQKSVPHGFGLSHLRGPHGERFLERSRFLKGEDA